MFILVGCWNNRDVTDLAIVSGIALDKKEDGLIELTVQIIKGSQMKPEGNSQEKAYSIISTEGETVFEAIRNLISQLNKKAFFPHMTLFILSEEFAKEGINQFIDFFERDNESKRKASVIIAKGIKAKEVIEKDSDLEKISVLHIVESLNSSNALCKSYKIEFIDMLKQYSQKGHSIVLPIIYPKSSDKISCQEDLIIEGSAILNNGKLIGYLTPYQTRGFLFCTNKVKSSVIVIPSPVKEEKLVTIEIIRSESKLSAKVKDSKPSFNIEIDAEGNIGEQQDDNDLTKEELIEDLEKEIENKIKSEIQNVIMITQKEYKSDIFGFINIIHQNHNKEWEKMVDNWDYIYSSSPINVEVKFDIRRTGTIKEPVAPRTK
jgi:spore germination protein KC